MRIRTCSFAAAQRHYDNLTPEDFYGEEHDEDCSCDDCEEARAEEEIEEEEEELQAA